MRTVCTPLILLLQPIRARPESVVGAVIAAITMCIVQPVAVAMLGMGYALVLVGIGIAVGYLFVIYGKEFEKERNGG